MATTRKTTAHRTPVKKLSPEREMILFKNDKTGILITVPEGATCSMDRDYDDYEERQCFCVVDADGSVLGKFFEITHYYDNRLNVRAVDPALLSAIGTSSSPSDEEGEEDYDSY